MKKILYVLFTLAFGYLLFGTPGPARSEEAHVFQRMWSVLQQPWYFNNPSGMAVDATGNVYVADTYNGPGLQLKDGFRGDGKLRRDHPGGY